MAAIVRKSFDQADETRPFADGKGRLDVIQTDGGAVGRGVFEPGWRWSEHIKPLAGTDSCQASHTGYVVSGRMKVVMDDGAGEEYGPGDFMQIGPGHDAWVVGDEPCVAVDWTGFGNYAKPAS
ncbi:cupin [Streptomyces sp. WM6372]|uniref:cupin domain-containing protein n=1 Tax=Streptomyces sp. WM6372 TaxID=1415555 RepID=UPI0006AF87CC|nr:cupin domain-containing protein [Streptomyces sp. WM6372]KOU21178.1 cupin [Streptomyces sp. WM6372]